MSAFITDEPGPDGLFGVFEDDGETGYLYVYEPEGRGIISHLQIYNNAQDLNVREEDVQVVWSKGGEKCGVVIWGGMRGVLDLRQDEGMRVKLESRDSHSINDPDLLQDFE